MRQNLENFKGVNTVAGHCIISCLFENIWSCFWSLKCLNLLEKMNKKISMSVLILVKIKNFFFGNLKVSTFLYLYEEL